MHFNLCPCKNGQDIIVIYYTLGEGNAIHVTFSLALVWTFCHCHYSNDGLAFDYVLVLFPDWLKSQHSGIC